MTEVFNTPWLALKLEEVEVEWRQCVEEGKDIEPLRERLEEVRAQDLKTFAGQQAALAFLDATKAVPLKPGFEYCEPSDLEGICAARPAAAAIGELALSAAELEDKVYGAWLGRVCGCLLGKPVEGWRRPRMWGYLKDTDRWPLDAYFTAKADAAILEKHGIDANRAYIETVEFMPEDDDTNYTTVGLALMQQRGPGFTPADVARFWMQNIPILHTCTAERLAYRNLSLGIAPPDSAVCRNPCREWIGAQIRADFFGYAAPGRPELAAEFAWRDACISHVKNGIYGEMWAAAMIASAFVLSDFEAIIEAGLAQIPQASRLHASIVEVLEWRREGIGYDDVVERVHARWDEDNRHDWCHTISNAMIVAIGLLWGESDYGLSICRAVQPCFDTDCNGATVGSIVGAVLGAAALPNEWTSPVNDTLATGVAGYHRVAISDMARLTMEVIDQVAAAD